MSEAGADADPLDLTSLDTDSLLTALAAVQRAVPDLLLDVKPVLAHLSAPEAGADEAGAVAARDAIERYMATVDFVLRQSVFYLRETRAAPSVLRAPPVDALPRPLAATLRDAPAGGEGAGDSEAQLGLYALRVEAASLRDMLAAVRDYKAERDSSKEQGVDDDAMGQEP